MLLPVPGVLVFGALGTKFTAVTLGLLKLLPLIMNDTPPAGIPPPAGGKTTIPPGAVSSVRVSSCSRDSSGRRRTGRRCRVPLRNRRLSRATNIDAPLRTVVPDQD